MDEKVTPKALGAELFGTFLLVFSVIVMVAIYAGATSGGQPLIPNIVFPFVAMGHAFVLFILIQTLGAYSGGHFNPAITLGLLSIKKISPSAAGPYVGVQLIGGILAGFLAALVIPNQAEVVSYAQPAIGASISTGSGIALEAIFTFILVWTVVATAVNPRGPKEWAPAAIASALALGVLLIGSLTGASLNPARALGPDLANALFGTIGDFGDVGDFLLAYVAAPIVGGIVAAVAYNAMYMRAPGTKPTPPPAPSEQSPF